MSLAVKTNVDADERPSRPSRLPINRTVMKYTVTPGINEHEYQALINNPQEFDDLAADMSPEMKLWFLAIVLGRFPEYQIDQYNFAGDDLAFMLSMNRGRGFPRYDRSMATDPDIIYKLATGQYDSLCRKCKEVDLRNERVVDFLRGSCSECNQWRRGEKIDGLTTSDMRPFLFDGVYGETAINGLCRCCRWNRIDRKTASVAHIIALRMGGPNTPDNLTVTCRPCNRLMSSRNLLSYESEIDKCMSVLANSPGALDRVKEEWNNFMEARRQTRTSGVLLTDKSNSIWNSVGLESWKRHEPSHITEKRNNDFFEKKARRKAEKEAKRMAEEEARRMAEEEARAREEEARTREEEARRMAEEEARRRAMNSLLAVQVETPTVRCSDEERSETSKPESITEPFTVTVTFRGDSAEPSNVRDRLGPRRPMNGEGRNVRQCQWR